jgi:hypothetical protein
MWNEWGEEEHIKVVSGKSGRNEITIKTKKWVDNIKMGLGEIGWSCMDWNFSGSG